MTKSELIGCLKIFDDDQELALTFVSKECKVLISNIICIRRRIDRNLIELVHCENEDVAKKVQKNVLEYDNYQLQ